LTGNGNEQEAIEHYCHKYPGQAAELIAQQKDCLADFRATWVQRELGSRSRDCFECLIARETFTVPGHWFTVERGVVTAFGFVWDDEDVDCLGVSWQAGHIS
jgi:hypothetical protein